MFTSKIIENTGKFTAIIFTLLQFIGFFTNEFITAEAIIIGTLVIPMRFIYLYRISDISKNMARFILWFSWDISMIVIPTFSFDVYSDTILKVMSGELIFIRGVDIEFCIRIGAYTLFLALISSVWWKNNKSLDADYYWRFSKMQLYLMIGFVCAINIIALILVKILGLGSFGEFGRALPFKMAAIINFFAYGATPFFYIFILDSLCKQKNNIIVPIVIILIMALFSSYVSLSKGALIAPMATVGAYLLITKRLSIFMSLIMLGILLMSFILASYIAAYRDSRTTIYDETLMSVKSGYSASQYVHRVFRDGILFIKFHAVASQDELHTMLKEYNYDVAYMNTYGIDKTSINTAHSSGCYPLPGAYVFGFTFYTIVVLLLSLITAYIDYGLVRSKTILASTMMIAYFSFYFVKMFWLSMSLEIITKLYNGTYNSTLYMILLILMYVVYLKFFCEKRENLNKF